MTLTPFEASKLVEWAEHVLTNGAEPRIMPRGIGEVDKWVLGCSFLFADEMLPFPKFDTEQPYTWEG